MRRRSRRCRRRRRCSRSVFGAPSSPQSGRRRRRARGRGDSRSRRCGPACRSPPARRSRRSRAAAHGRCADSRRSRSRGACGRSPTRSVCPSSGKVSMKSSTLPRDVAHMDVRNAVAVALDQGGDVGAHLGEAADAEGDGVGRARRDGEQPVEARDSLPMIRSRPQSGESGGSSGCMREAHAGRLRRRHHRRRGSARGCPTSARAGSAPRCAASVLAVTSARRKALVRAPPRVVASKAVRTTIASSLTCGMKL